MFIRGYIMNLYEAIYTRKTVRQFNQKPLEVVTMLHFKNFIKAVLGEEYCKGCSVDIIDTLSSNKKAKGMFKVIAPYYFVVQCDNNTKGFMQAGLVAQMLVLYLTSKGIGTCYQGNVTMNTIKNDSKLCEGIVVAFGYSNESVHREWEKAKRQKLKDIVYFKEEINSDIEHMLESARLAPSAFNLQPWRFVVYHNRIHIFLRKELFPLKKMKQTNGINIGIVLSHLLIGAEELWIKASVTQVDSLAERQLKNHEYVTSVLLEI